MKDGDVPALLAPEPTDRVVALMITDNDVALLHEGLPVRIQLAGWPALQFSRWPSAAVGTFAGRVAVIDALDDGTANYRVVVKPDVDAIAAKKEDAWPWADILRPVAEATGWILLRRFPSAMSFGDSSMPSHQRLSDQKLVLSVVIKKRVQCQPQIRLNKEIGSHRTSNLNCQSKDLSVSLVCS